MRLAPPAALLLGALLTTSCLGLGGEPPNITRHSIHLFKTEPVCAAPVFPSLAVRSFEGRQRYEARVLVRDEVDGTIHYLENDRWLEDPQDALTDVVREGLAQTGAFEVVGPATSGFTGEYILDGTVLRCDVVRSSAGPWRAVLVLRLDAARVADSSMLNADTYIVERDLPDASTRGLSEVMSECAKDVTLQAVADWLENAPESARIETPPASR